MPWMFLQCRSAAQVKVLQSAAPDPVIQITWAVVMVPRTRKRGGTALAARCRQGPSRL